jgi:hypothetical protein
MAKRAVGTRPSLGQAAYAGRYRDAWYGDVVITEQDGKLRMRFTHTPWLEGTLEHFHHDTFLVRWDRRWLLADAYLWFSPMTGAAVHVNDSSIRLYCSKAIRQPPHFVNFSGNFAQARLTP